MTEIKTVRLMMRRMWCCGEGGVVSFNKDTCLLYLIVCHLSPLAMIGDALAID